MRIDTKSFSNRLQYRQQFSSQPRLGGRQDQTDNSLCTEQERKRRGVEILSSAQWRQLNLELAEELRATQSSNQRQTPKQTQGGDPSLRQLVFWALLAGMILGSEQILFLFERTRPYTDRHRKEEWDRKTDAEKQAARENHPGDKLWCKYELTRMWTYRGKRENAERREAERAAMVGDTDLQEFQGGVERGDDYDAE